MTEPLERLARLAGVATSYDDVFGVAQRAEPQALRAVLGALGFEARDDAAVERSAREAGAERGRRRLEPVYVVDADGDREITIALGTSDPPAPVWWLRSEDGHVSSGTVSRSALRALDALDVDGERFERFAFPLDRSLGLGYHTFALATSDGERRATVALVPGSAYRPPQFERRGAWGLAVQLYALRSRRSWGIGDFTDLALLCDAIREAGGSAVGLNPLHDVRAGASPYSPSSRLFSNAIYLDVERLPGYRASDTDGAALAAVRASDLIDYAAVRELKRSVARVAFDRFRTEVSDSFAADAERFRAFVAAGGDELRRAGIWNALADRFADDSGGGDDWTAWPEAFRDPASSAVAAFAREREVDVAFYAFLQWQCDEQLAACAKGGRLAIGLYRDLAVGAALHGSDTWAMQDALSRSAAAGAPPDLLNTAGQDWGVAPFDPLGLRQAAYAPFVALLRANMRHAGALRIDHVMALARLYLIPSGAPATSGAYVTYELDELLGIVALESVRARCLVIGEDLGTVPAGFRERLATRGILSYRLLQFEADGAEFAAPNEYPELALVSIGTHDLPPIGAYWTGYDIGVRARIGLLDAAAAERERSERATKREGLLAAFEAELETARDDLERYRRAANLPPDGAALSDLALVANRYLARTPSRLLMVQLEDVLGDVEQVNVPTTTDEHPNWRRRSSIALEDLATDKRFVRLAAALRRERGFAYDPA